MWKCVQSCAKSNGVNSHAVIYDTKKNEYIFIMFWFQIKSLKGKAACTNITDDELVVGQNINILTWNKKMETMIRISLKKCREWYLIKKNQSIEQYYVTGVHV